MKNILKYKKVLFVGVFVLLFILSIAYIISNLKPEKDISLQDSPAPTTTSFPDIETGFGEAVNNNLQEEATKQAEDDILFNQEYMKFHDKYPWYRQLPIEGTHFRIIYDFTKKQFRIRLLVEPKSEAEKEQVIKTAVAALEKTGVEPPVQYYVLDFVEN